MFSDKKKSIEELLQHIQNLTPAIVAIDGVDGSGKSTYVAPYLSGDLNAKVFEIDQYLNKHNNGYYEYLKIDKLRNDLSKSQSKIKILDGVMIQNVLHALSINDYYLVYVTDSVWLNDWTSYLEEDMSLKEIKDNVENNINRIPKAPGESEYKLQGFRNEMYEYTYNQKPLQNSNAIVVTNF